MAVSGVLHALIISCYDEKDYIGSWMPLPLVPRYLHQGHHADRQDKKVYQQNTILRSCHTYKSLVHTCYTTSKTILYLHSREQKAISPGEDHLFKKLYLLLKETLGIYLDSKRQAMKSYFPVIPYLRSLQ